MKAVYIAENNKLLKLPMLHNPHRRLILQLHVFTLLSACNTNHLFKYLVL
jgi:hypothetical protein